MAYAYSKTYQNTNGSRSEEDAEVDLVTETHALQAAKVERIGRQLISPRGHVIKRVKEGV